MGENLVLTVLDDKDPKKRKIALLKMIKSERATEVLELTGIAVISEDPEIRSIAIQRIIDRGNAARTVALIHSWRENGYLMAMAEQMNAEERMRAAEIEADFLKKRLV